MDRQQKTEKLNTSSLPLSDFPELSLEPGQLPRHIAIVMDGNGRWATRRGLARYEGHRRGKDSVRAVVEAARELGIPYLTLFAFSSENWQRPSAEVRFLMQLLHRYLITETKRMMKRDIRLIALGDCTRLPLQVQKALKETVECTAGQRAMTGARAGFRSGPPGIAPGSPGSLRGPAAGPLRGG